MNLSVNGQSQVPPGFRFHPTEEELLHYYLTKKVSHQKIDLDVIREVDLNKLEPWDIQEKCKIGSTPQNDWYFYSHKDRKYPTGIRINRATAAGFWKATGRDKVIYSSFKRIGMRKTLVFYMGRAPHGQKSDWIMHEYRLDDDSMENNEDGWVVCRVFRKKDCRKSVDGPKHSSITTNAKIHMLNSRNEATFDQVPRHKGRTSKEEFEASNNIQIINNNDDKNNMKVIGSFGFTISNEVHNEEFDQDSRNEGCYQPSDVEVITGTEASITNQGNGNLMNPAGYNSETSIKDWTTPDWLVACFNNPNLTYCPSLDHDLLLQQLQSDYSMYQSSQDYSSEMDLWNFSRLSSSTSDPFGYVRVEPL